MNKIWKIANWLSSKIGVRGDYVLHFRVCFLSTSLTGLIPFGVVSHFFRYVSGVVSSLFGAVFAAGLSIGKETGDKNNLVSGWSWWDLVTEGLGVFTGLIVHFLTICCLFQ